MILTRNLLASLALLATCPEAMAAEPVPGAYTAEPPLYIRALLLHLKERDRPREALNALASWDKAAPYLRLALAAATDKGHKRDLSEALEAIEARAFERNRERYTWW